MTTYRKIQNNVTRALAGGAIALTFSIANTPTAAAGSKEDACSIWLCMPAGFPGGCGKAFSAMKKRLRKGKSPLPSLLSCTNGKTKGSYETGYEPFADCRPGYSTRDIRDDDGFNFYGAPSRRICINPASCSYEDRIFYGGESARFGGGDRGNRYCTDQYNATRRADPWWVEMEIEGKDLGGRFYYSRN